jgi:hypothetical protein
MPKSEETEGSEAERRRGLRCKRSHFAKTTRPLVSVRVHKEDCVIYRSPHVRRVDVES